MNMFRRLLALSALSIVLLGHPFSALAAPLSVGKDIAYSVVVDPQGALTLEQAQQRLENELEQQRFALSRGYTRDTFWLRFELGQELFQQKDRWLELTPDFVDDIQLFFREQGLNGAWQHRQTGDLFNGVSDLDYHNAVFVLPALANHSQGYEVLIRLRSTSTVLLSAQLWTPEEFVGHASRSTSFWSFYFGLAALSTLLAVIMAIIIRTYLLWSAASFAVVYVLIISIQGYVNWIFPNLAFPLQHYATSVFSLCIYAVLFWMSSEILNLREKLAWAHRLLIWIAFCILSLVVLIPFDHYGTAIKIKAFLLFPAYGLFFCVVLVLWVKERFHLLVLALAVLPAVFMGASLFSLLAVLGWVPFKPELYLVWQYASVANLLQVLAISVYRIRKQRLAEFEQEKLASELETEREANFNQRQFIGTVSHEFRTPLAVVSAALENLYCLEQGQDSARMLRYEKIKRANDRLIQLTDNCLADARLAGDVTALDIQPVDLLQLVSSAASLVGLSGKHSLRITVDGKAISATSAAYKVAADPAMMRIALSNVIDNAVKYADRGVIAIDCSKVARQVRVRISDQGPGIAGLAGDEVFQRYRRGTTLKQGSGLGLFVARQIAQACAGDLHCVASSAKGSCFEFSLEYVAG